MLSFRITISYIHIDFKCLQVYGLKCSPDMTDRVVNGYVLYLGYMIKNKIIFGLAVAVTLLLVFFGMRSAFTQFTQSAFEPLRQTNEQLGTQVARLLNPTPTILPDPVTIIQQVRPLARLETIQYSVQKVITAETGQEVLKDLFGDRLLFVAHGVVIAGVDLSMLEAEDIEIRDGIPTITLPPAEIFMATLDNDKSYVYDRDTGLLRKSDPNLETLARQAAEKEIRDAALEDGILEQASVNAQVFLTRLLGSLGFNDVIFR